MSNSLNTSTRQSVPKIIVAAAGSGKTTRIVSDALHDAGKRSLIVTYTLNNLAEIKKKLLELNGCIPENIEVRTWFSFLLQECARPYQKCVYEKRIASIAFVEGRSPGGISKTNTSPYFFADGQYIYTDKISEFSCLCNERMNGQVIDRLRNIYDCIYIDEVQDLAGYDLEFLEGFLKAKFDMVLVGDHRQTK